MDRVISLDSAGRPKERQDMHTTRFQQIAVKVKPVFVPSLRKAVPIKLGRLKRGNGIRIRNPFACCGIGELGKSRKLVAAAFGHGARKIFLKIAKEQKWGLSGEFFSHKKHRSEEH